LVTDRLPYALDSANARYMRFSAAGRSALVERGSNTETVLRLLLEGGYKAFVSREIAPETGFAVETVSNILLRLRKRGVLGRTPKMAWLDHPAPEYVYYMPWEEDSVEQYLVAKLSGYPELVRAYYYISSNEDALSSIEIREKYDADPKQLRSTFVAAGLIGAKKEHVAGKWYEWFFYPSNDTAAGLDAAQPKTVSERIRQKKARLSAMHKEAVARGAKLENQLYQAFEHIMRTGSLEFRLTNVRKQVRKKIGDRLRIFDLTLEFTPFFQGEPLKYASKRLILAVEAKHTVTGGAVVDRHKLDVDRAYPGQGIPVIATTTPTMSAFDAFRDYPCIILTGKQLDSILEANSCEKEKESPIESPAPFAGAKPNLCTSTGTAKDPQDSSAVIALPQATPESLG